MLNQNYIEMNTKYFVGAVFFVTTSLIVEPLIEHKKITLHTHVESDLPVYNPAEVKVYGNLRNQSIDNKTTICFATLIHV